MSSIREHLQSDYLRSEFKLITPKIDSAWPHAPELRRLINGNVSLDQIFERVTIPILIAYDSRAVRDHDRECEQFRAAFKTEMLHGWQSFADRIGSPNPLPVQVRLFLAPLGSKTILTNELERRLQGWR